MQAISTHTYNTRLATNTIQRVNYEEEPEELEEQNEELEELEEEITDAMEESNNAMNKLPIFTVVGFNESDQPIVQTTMTFTWLGDAFMYGLILTELGKMDESYYERVVKYNDYARYKLTVIFSEIKRPALNQILFHYPLTRVKTYKIKGDDGAVYDCPLLRKRFIEEKRIFAPISASKFVM